MNIYYSPSGYEGQPDDAIHAPLVKYLAERCGVRLMASPGSMLSQSERLSCLEQADGMVAELSSRRPEVELDLRHAATRFGRPSLVLYQGVNPDILEQYTRNPLVVHSGYTDPGEAQATIWRFLWRDHPPVPPGEIRDPLKMSLRTAVDLDRRSHRKLSDAELAEIDRENTAEENEMLGIVEPD